MGVAVDTPLALLLLIPTLGLTFVLYAAARRRTGRWRRRAGSYTAADCSVPTRVGVYVHS